MIKYSYIQNNPGKSVGVLKHPLEPFPLTNQNFTKGHAMRRRKMNRKKSKKLFSRTARKTNKKNNPSGKNPMRGGYRL